MRVRQELWHSRHLIAGVFILLAFTWCDARAEVIHGTVTAVHDGDTLTMLAGCNCKFRVRLKNIDAPELLQPFGSEARDSLVALCLGKRATVSTTSRDNYGRAVGQVTCRTGSKGIDVNKEQVRRGMAMVYDGIAPKSSPLWIVETAARIKGSGMWVLEDPTPPWVWRRQHPPGDS